MSAVWGPSGYLSRTPLRVKLVAGLIAITALAEIITGAAAAGALRSYLVDRVDERLATATSRLLVPALEPADAGDLPSDFLVRVADAQGNGETRAGFGETAPALQLPTLDLASARRIQGQPFTVGTSDRQERWRALVTVATNSRTGEPVSILMALPLTTVDATVHQLSLIILVVTLAVLALLGGLAYALVRSSLRPLVEVERTAKAIASGQLSSRVPEADPRTEVGRLTAALNGMLGRIEHAFAAKAASESAARVSEDRMRRFVADASHELRTPLTSIRGFAELHRHGGIPAEDVDRVLGRVESEATRMSLLVDDLLLLARLDRDRPIEQRPVDLLSIATDTVGDARALSADHEVTLVVRDGPPPVVLGDEQRLRQVATNLVFNAVRHTPAGTQVTVTVGAEDAGAVFEVADTGPGMAAEDAERIFERFYRVDAARSRAQGGTGLGLSIVAAIVRAHGGTVQLTTAPSDGATFSVRLPHGLGDEGPDAASDQADASLESSSESRQT